MTKPKHTPRPKRTRDGRPPTPTPETSAPEGAAPFATSYRFGRLLVWHFELNVDSERVLVYLVHVSHEKADGPAIAPAPPLLEQLLEPAPTVLVSIPRAAFTDDEQIATWFAEVCSAFENNLYGILQFEIDHHFSDLIRFQLDLAGIQRHDKNTIIREHIEGTKPMAEGGSIGTREFLRILLGARGRGNKSPANEFNLPKLIRAALRNLSPSRLHTFEGVNNYLKQHFRTYASTNGESLRKKCKQCGIDFRALVREERERRNAETGKLTR